MIFLPQKIEQAWPGRRCAWGIRCLLWLASHPAWGGLFALVKASPPGPPSRRRLHLDKVRLITVSPFSHVGLLPTDVTWLVSQSTMCLLDVKVVIFHIPEQCVFWAFRGWLADKDQGDPHWVMTLYSLPPSSIHWTCYLLLVIKYGKGDGQSFPRWPYATQDCVVADWKERSLPGLKAAAWLWGSGRGPQGGLAGTTRVSTHREPTRKGGFHPSTTRIWILAATVLAWRRTNSRKDHSPKTLVCCLLRPWAGDPDKLCLDSWPRATVAIITMCCLKTLSVVICYAAEKTDMMTMSF